MGKKRFLGFLLLAAVIFTTMALTAQAVEYFEPFNVYTDKNARGNHFAPSGWMGDYADISFTDAWQENPYSGTSCIKVTYRPNVSQGARFRYYAATRTCGVFVNGALFDTVTKAETGATPWPSLYMNFINSVKFQGTTTHTMYIDWWACAQYV